MEHAVDTGAVIRFRGIVQGVGFRPLLYRKARLNGLRGIIRNTEDGVYLRVDGPRGSIERFYREILENPPPFAEIHESSVDYTGPGRFDGLRILHSTEYKGGFTPVSPDIATCGECLEEISDPGNRRHRYPFTNCTNCGPRFTILRTIPYDRKNTTMSVFPMCPDCDAEYHDLLDRRYHAQPNACPACGPRLRLVVLEQGEGGVRTATPEHGEEPAAGGECTPAAAGDCTPESQPGTDALAEALRLLGRGGIVAVRGLGGYHLAVSPRNPEWVQRLRERKGRPAKPFALMARDLDTARK
ncbi:MAG: acylphosphatase, partial [Spirochaetota bacterium]